MKGSRAHGATSLLSAAVLAGTLGAARAGMDAGMFMGHDGSTIQEFTDSRSLVVEYRYVSVRPNLPVRVGTVLFRGTKASDGHLKGRAFVFPRHCGPAGYDVAGWQTVTRVVLEGAAPIRDPVSCSVLRYDARSPSARLVFEIAE